jgi:hypothetical protein
MLGQLLPKLARILAYVVLFATALILTGWRYFAPYVPKIEPNQLFGIFIAITGVISLEFYKLLSSLRLSSIVHVQDVSISEGIRSGIGIHKAINHLRVWASTTEVILPNIRDCAATFDVCEVLIQNHCDSDDETKQTLIRQKVENATQTWKDLVQQGVIRKLVIKQFSFTPSQYMVIFEDRFVLVGLFVPSPLKAHAVDFINPFAIDSSTERGRDMIQRYTKQFDRLFASLPESIGFPVTRRKAAMREL